MTTKQVQETNMQVAPHYIFLVFDSAQHVAPVISLADKIMQANPDHAATATIYIACTYESKWGSAPVPDNLGNNITVVKLKVQPDGEHFIAPFMYSLQHPDELANNCVTAIKEDLEARSAAYPCVSICDNYGSVWSAKVAQQLNVKSYIFMPTAMLMWSVLKVLPQVQFDCNGVLEVPYYGPLRHLQLPPMNPLFNYLSEQCELVKQHEGMFILDREETYGPEYVAALREYTGDNLFVGYLPPTAERVQAAMAKEGKNLDLTNWLDQQKLRSVIYIALGSMVSLSKADQVELALALEELQIPFIWALKKRTASSDLSSYRPPHAPEDFKERDCNVDCDDYGLPKGWLERVESFGKVVEWAPQLAILNHPATGLFVSHCGWNSLTESICLAGVPMVCIPMANDQCMNADMVEKRLKIGKGLWNNPTEGILKKETTVATIREVIGDATIAENAAKLKKSNEEQWKADIGSSMKKLREFCVKMNKEIKRKA